MVYMEIRLARDGNPNRRQHLYDGEIDMISMPRGGYPGSASD